MEETIAMSSKEISRLEVMQRLKDKRLRQKEAAQLLGISVRQVKRLWKSYRKEAAKGLVSKKRGRVSNNHLDAGMVQEVLDLLKRSTQILDRRWRMKRWWKCTGSGSRGKVCARS